jgi:hypothetical protein
VQEIYLIGLKPEDYPASDRVHHIPIKTTSTIQEKISAGWESISRKHPEVAHLVVSTGDAPAVSTKAINQFFNALNNNPTADVLIPGVPEDITKSVFPEHGRVIGKFVDQNLYVGEMFALSQKSIPILKNEIDQLANRRLRFNRRKDTTKLLPILKYFARRPSLWLLIFKYLRGTLSLEEARLTLSKELNLELCFVVIPDVGFGMDMDLPEDYQKLSSYIERTKIPAY